MTNQPNQTITIRFIADTQDAIARARNFRDEVDQVKERMRAAAQASGASFKDLAVGMQQAAKIHYDQQIAQIRQMGEAAGWSAQQIQQAIAPIQAQAAQSSKAISTGLSELTGKAGGLAGQFGVVGQAIGTALGLGTVQLISKAIGWIKSFIAELGEATEQAYQFSKAIFQIQVGVNAMRRQGVELTFKDVIDQLDNLKTKFGIFSKTDLVQGAAAFLNLNRNMGFTKQELFELQEAVATLAVVNGRSMDEVQRTVALALSSGYTEGLQRLGVSINRVTIAEQAAKLGYADSYMALTELERAEATRIQILDKTRVYSEDLYQYQKTLPGQIDSITASIKDLNTATGNLLMPIKELLVEIKLSWAEFKKWFVENSLIVYVLTDLQLSIQEVKNSGKGFGQFIWDEFTKPFKDASAEANNFWDWIKIFARNAIKGKPSAVEQYRESLGETGVTEPGVTPPAETGLTQDQIQAIDDAAKRMLDLQEQYNNDARDLAIDLERDLIKIKQDGIDKLEDMAAEHAQKMLDIERKGWEGLNQLQADYDLSVKQVWDSYYVNLANATERHNNKMLKIEEDYQEKLQRIKESFLMDLEDALHERDARAILTLIKRYNLEREQARRERDQNKTDEQRAYEEQLHEMERQRDLRLKQMEEEFKARYAEMYNEMVQELKLEDEKYIHERLQQEEKNKQDIADRQLRYSQDLEDLKRHLDDRIRELAKGLSQEVNITGQAMTDVMNILTKTLGPRGNAELIYNYYVQMVIAAMNAAAQASAAFQTFLPVVNNPGIPDTGNHAEGGIEFANKRTTATFGEGGPELALFVPLRGGLGSISSSKAVAKTPELKAAGKEKMQIELLLSPGIEAKIVDQTLDEVAEVILKRLR